jgi:hypothetical protein
VDEVTFAINEDITVMPVFDLQEVRDDRVRGERTDEGSLGASEAA